LCDANRFSSFQFIRSQMCHFTLLGHGCKYSAYQRRQGGANRGEVIALSNGFNSLCNARPARRRVMLAMLPTLKIKILPLIFFTDMLQEKLIQIAGVIDAAEAQMLQQSGVHYLGFPLRLPVHREDLTEEAAAAIITSLAPPVFGVLITYLHEASEIARSVMRWVPGSCSSMATSSAISWNA
jgi:hypothetical protein